MNLLLLLETIATDFFFFYFWVVLSLLNLPFFLVARGCLVSYGNGFVL